jgi:hypothetical protein
VRGTAGKTATYVECRLFPVVAVPLDKGEGANDDWKEEEAEGGLLTERTAFFSGEKRFAIEKKMSILRVPVAATLSNRRMGSPFFNKIFLASLSQIT